MLAESLLLVAQQSDCSQQSNCHYFWLDEGKSLLSRCPNPISCVCWANELNKHQQRLKKCSVCLRYRTSQSLSLSSFESQVVTWLQGPGSELLKTHQEIGDSMRAAQALQQKHEEIESQHSVIRLPKHTCVPSTHHVTTDDP